MDRPPHVVIGMAEAHAADTFAQMLTEIALSVGRLREMADEAHALVENLQNRPPIVAVKKWGNATTPAIHPIKRRESR